MLTNLGCIVKAVIYTKKNTDENRAELDAAGTPYRVEPNGLVRLDSKGKPSIMLMTLAGESVNANVLAGSVAESNDFEPNSVHAVVVTEKESNEYGRQFTFTSVGRIQPWQVQQAMASYPPVFIHDVTGAGTGSAASAATIDAANAVVEEDEE